MVYLASGVLVEHWLFDNICQGIC